MPIQPDAKTPIALEVECITKPDRASPHERIQKIGGDGWKHPLDEAIKNIQNKTHTYYVVAGTISTPVHIVYHPQTGKPYLRTKKDGTPTDNLLNLPDCA